MDTVQPGAPRPLRVLQFLGSLFFTAFFLLWTFCYGIFFTLISLLLPFRARFALARVWAQVILAVLRWTCRLACCARSPSIVGAARVLCAACSRRARRDWPRASGS